MRVYLNSTYNPDLVLTTNEERDAIEYARISNENSNSENQKYVAYKAICE